MSPDTCHDPGARACETCGEPTTRFAVVLSDGSPAYYSPQTRNRPLGTRCIPRCSACRLMWRIAAATRPPPKRGMAEASMSRIQQTHVVGESWLEDPEFLRRLLEDRS